MLPTHISAEIVTEMGKAFDFEALEQGNEEALASKWGPWGCSLFTCLALTHLS